MPETTRPDTAQLLVVSGSGVLGSAPIYSEEDLREIGSALRPSSVDHPLAIMQIFHLGSLEHSLRSASNLPSSHWG